MSLRFISKSPEETMAFGQRLAKHLKAGDILCLFGALGTGKTVMIKGLARGLKVDPTCVNSPTFVLMNMYEGRLPLFHFDLYRLEETRELDTVGYDEFLYGNGVAVVEWADRLQHFLPKEYLAVELGHRKGDGRTIRIAAKGKRYQDLIGRLEKEKGK